MDAGILQSPSISFYKGNGLNVLTGGRTFDTIYVDPSRRVKTQKVFMLKDCEPNIPEVLSHLLQHCSRLIIKTSPLLDIQAGLKELDQVTAVHVISLKNDCKELLWIIDTGTKFTEPDIFCNVLGAGTLQQYSFKLSEERQMNLEQFSKPLTYLYEPDVALLKAGCFKLICRDFNLNKFHKNSHLYTSNVLNENFLGRKFLIKKWGAYKSFMQENSIKKANVISRNFPLSPEEIKKKHKLTDGGDEFFIFTTGHQNQLLVLQCSKLN
jgi:hypothetical protein